jgi:hypothetical protein
LILWWRAIRFGRADPASCEEACLPGAPTVLKKRELENTDMSAIMVAVGAGVTSEPTILPEAPVCSPSAGMRNAFVRWFRGLAWRVLDLETEFEVLN